MSSPLLVLLARHQRAQVENQLHTAGSRRAADVNDEDSNSRTSVMMSRLAIRRRVLGPKWLVTMMRRPASGNLNLEGLAFMISSTITTDPRL